MRYSEKSVEGRLLQDDPKSLGLVMKWIADSLTSPRFWPLRDEIGDIVQEVLQRVVESLHQGRYDDRRDFALYVHGIARNTALRALKETVRRSKDHNSLSPDKLAAASDRPATDALARTQVVKKVLDFASEECRFLLHAYYLDESSYEEIATSLGIPIGTVKSKLFRCVEAARDSMPITVRRRERQLLGDRLRS